jgi:rRNA maturation RNase YbeY
MEPGSVEVAVVRKYPVPAELTDERIADLITHCLIEEAATGNWQVAAAFMDDSEMRFLHAQFMNDPESTDILTFPYDDPDTSGGDIAICVPVAAEQAMDNGTSLADELAFLLLHGVLHLVGYDDQSDDDRSVMLARQQAILESWFSASR